MSVSDRSWRFVLDEDEELGYDYDEAGDILYLWRGDQPSEAISFETPEGHLLRVDENTLEIVGITLFDWSTLLGQRTLELTVTIDDATARGLGRHRLDLCPA